MSFGSWVLQTGSIHVEEGRGGLRMSLDLRYEKVCDRGQHMRSYAVEEIGGDERAGTRGNGVTGTPEYTHPRRGCDIHKRAPAPRAPPVCRVPSPESLGSASQPELRTHWSRGGWCLQRERLVAHNGGVGAGCGWGERKKGDQPSTCLVPKQSRNLHVPAEFQMDLTYFDSLRPRQGEEYFERNACQRCGLYRPLLIRRMEATTATERYQVLVERYWRYPTSKARANLPSKNMFPDAGEALPGGGRDYRLLDSTRPRMGVGVVIVYLGKEEAEKEMGGIDDVKSDRFWWGSELVQSKLRSTSGHSKLTGSTKPLELHPAVGPVEPYHPVCWVSGRP
ncbi:hypothetical protein FB451DRAFT_1369065 [Mycena latifolia]|nr:hypothetical protein FB451DRAFT_1369065 [Mycena latifolia]